MLNTIETEPEAAPIYEKKRGGTCILHRETSVCGALVIYYLREYATPLIKRTNGYSICVVKVATKERAKRNFIATKSEAVRMFGLITSNKVTPCVLNDVLDDLLVECQQSEVYDMV